MRLQIKSQPYCHLMGIQRISMRIQATWTPVVNDVESSTPVNGPCGHKRSQFISGSPIEHVYLQDWPDVPRNRPWKLLNGLEEQIMAMLIIVTYLTIDGTRQSTKKMLQEGSGSISEIEASSNLEILNTLQ